MDHSVNAYLKRLPSDKLECLLQECLQNDVRSRYGAMLPKLLKALLERADGGDLNLSPEIREYLVRNLQ